MAVQVPPGVVIWVVLLGGVVLGVILRSMLWHHYIRCPRRFAGWLAALIAEWSRRSGYTHWHILPEPGPDGPSAFPIERLCEMLRTYARENEPNCVNGAE